jgi:hypothetical protein
VASPNPTAAGPLALAASGRGAGGKAMQEFAAQIADLIATAKPRLLKRDREAA